jgi:hypothetical protein
MFRTKHTNKYIGAGWSASSRSIFVVLELGVRSKSGFVRCGMVFISSTAVWDGLPCLKQTDANGVKMELDVCDTLLSTGGGLQVLPDDKNKYIIDISE